MQKKTGEMKTIRQILCVELEKRVLYRPWNDFLLKIYLSTISIWKREIIFSKKKPAVKPF